MVRSWANGGKFSLAHKIELPPLRTIRPALTKYEFRNKKGHSGSFGRIIDRAIMPCRYAKQPAQLGRCGQQFFGHRIGSCRYFQSGHVFGDRNCGRHLRDQVCNRAIPLNVNP